MESSHLYLSFYILFVEAVLNRMKMKIILPLFISFIFACDLTTRKWTLETNTLIRLNILTRLYVMTYLFFRLYAQKHDEQVKEEELSEEANTLNKMQEEEMNFMKKFSHFTKTTLNGIINYLSFFKRTRSFQDIKAKMSNVNECLEFVESSCSEIQYQSEELVEYYLIRNKKLIKEQEKTIDKEVVDLHKLVDYVVKVQSKLRFDSNEKKRKGVKLIVEKETNFPRLIKYDREKLIRIITNIFSNSIKYTDSGSVTVFLGSCKSKDSHKHHRYHGIRGPKEPEPLRRELGRDLVIKVTDTGIGITKDLLGQVYDAFIPNLTGKQSFSIGLVITHSFVKRLGGDITIFSEGKNLGTTACVTLPYELAEKDDEILCSGDFRQQQEWKKRLRKVSDVLIVEDNFVNQKVFKRQVEMIFGEDDVRIHVAENGIVGLEKLEMLSSKAPLVIADISMPDCDGIEFCWRVREKSYGHKIVIYSLTAAIIGSEEKFCEKYGFDGVSSKPVTLTKMKDVIRFMVKRREKKMFRDLRDRDVHPSPPPAVSLKIKKVSIENQRDVRQKYFKDIMGAIFNFFMIFGILLSCPEELSNGWKKAVYGFVCICLVQYSLLFFFRWSPDTNNMITILRIIACTVFTSEYSFFQNLENSYLTNFAFIIQSIESVDSFSRSLFVSILSLILNFYYELTREYDFYPILNVSGESYASFMRYFHYTSIVVLTTHVIVCSTEFVRLNEEKKKKWNQIISEKQQIKKEYNLTTAKVSHDLATPASSLVVYLDEVRGCLEENGMIKYKIKNLKRKNMKTYQMIDIISSRKDDLWFDNFKTMIGCSLEIELAIHNFLTCCKIKHDMIISRMSPNIEFRRFIETIVDQFRILLGPKTVLDLKYDPRFFTKGYERLSMDTLHVRLILMNLLMNALQHSRAENILMKFKIKEDDERFIRVKIRDDGIGIPGKYCSKGKIRIMNDGLDSSKKRKDHEFHFRERFCKSLGLGHVVSKFLSQKIGSMLHFSTTRFGGTFVEFCFPFETADREEEEENEGEKVLSDEPKKDVLDVYQVLKNKSPQELSVLCVDDSCITLKFVKMFLTRLKFGKVVAKENEQDAIEELNREDEVGFDILITDYNLVRMNAIEMIARVDPKNVPKVVICVTGDGGIHQSEVPVINAILSKPVRYASLKNALRRFLDC